MEWLANRTWERRHELRLTQVALAQRAGVSERFVRTVEDGKPTVRLDKVLLLLRALGLRIRIEPLPPSDDLATDGLPKNLRKRSPRAV